MNRLYTENKDIYGQLETFSNELAVKENIIKSLTIKFNEIKEELKFEIENNSDVLKDNTLLVQKCNDEVREERNKM